jgi:hypothetical protein
LKGARIASHDFKSTIDCTVRDLSETGACLIVPSQVGIPETFLLLMRDGKSKQPCRVAWRSGNRIGVAFE